LVVGADIGVLQRHRLARSYEGQEDVDVHVVVGQVADVQLRSRNLRGVVPQDVAVTGIAASVGDFGLVLEQAG
jgi:hypothetical protein